MGTSVFPFGGVRQVSKTLTNAQIKDLPIAPITVVPAAGAGLVVAPSFVSVRLNWVGNYATFDANAAILFRWQASGTNPVLYAGFEPISSSVSALLASGESYTAFAGPIVRGAAAGTPAGPFIGRSAFADGDAANSAFQIYADNGGLSFTSGNAGNTMTVTTLYYLFHVTTGAFV